MKRYLVLYDYGTGGVWATMAAGSAEAIAQKYPLLAVVARPDWMTDQIYEGLTAYSLEQEADDFLRALSAEAAS